MKKFIYSKLQNEFGNTLKLHLTPHNNYRYDLIITNHKINNNQIPVIQISNKTILDDLIYIRKFISPYKEIDK